MKNIFILLFIYFHAITLFAQEREYIEPYSHKFYKIDGKIYGLKNILPSKTLPKLLPNALLYYANLQDKVERLFPPKGITRLGSYYPNVRWDINESFFLNMAYWGSAQYAVESGDIFFFRILEIQQWGEISPLTNKSKMEELMFSDENYTEKTTLSHNFTGLWEIGMKRIHGSNGDYWHYDLILQKDETLLMPVAYKDSLYLYYYKDKAWTTPNYQGAEKNAENDYWTRIWQIKHDFKTHFRAFQIENDLYFLTNADTTIYKYENNTLKEIGKIQPKKTKEPYF